MTRSRQTTDGIEYGGGSDPSRWMTYTYNLSGAMTEQQYPSGRVVRNVLDNDGSLSMVQSKRNASFGYHAYASGFNYNAAGAVTSMQLGNGRWESTAFNSRLQPVQIALGSTGTAEQAYDLLKLDYGYGTTNNNGNVLSQTITVPSVTIGGTTHNGFTAVQNYTYDSLNRLDDAAEYIAGNQTWRQDFSYDRYGNRNFVEANTTFQGFDKLCANNTELCADLRKVLNPSANASDNRLSSTDGYVFDPSGNTVRDPQSRRFTYGGENKQVKVETLDLNGNPVSTVGEYTYDGDGKRVKKHVPSTGEVTVFVYDAGGKLIGEYSTIVETQSPKVSYRTADHLGSPRILTDQNGATISRRDFHPFGEETASQERNTALGYQTDSVRQKFTGYERDDESSLDFAQARYYVSGFGRFSSVDPIFESMETSMPQSMNRYTYVLNNPLFYVDPNGELWVKNEKPEYGRTQEYIWVDECGKGQTCYTAIAVSGKYEVTVYGSNDYKDITKYQANKDGVIDVRALSMHHDASFEVANFQNVPEEFLSTNASSTLFNVAKAYSQDFPGDDKLVFTAGSAKNGKPGICDGAPCHGGHKGDDIDLRYMGVDGKVQQGKNSWGRAAINRTNYLIQKFAEAGFNHAFTGNDSAFGQPDPSPKYIDNLEKVHHHHLHVGKTAPKQKRK